MAGLREGVPRVSWGANDLADVLAKFCHLRKDSRETHCAGGTRGTPDETRGTPSQKHE